MKNFSRKSWVGALAITVATTLSGAADASTIMFGIVGDSGFESHAYHQDGEDIALYLTNDGHTVITFNLWSSALTSSDFVGVDQVWVYDLATGSNTSGSSVANYSMIADWFDSSSHDLILDGRMISSPWAGGTEEVWIQAYANELASRSGGLVLGTDHSAYVDGINTINSLIDVDLFHDDFFGSFATVDQASPLYSATGTVACGAERCIYDNSSPGFVATGQQVDPNIFLTPVAYHGTISSTDFENAYDQAAVSSTFGSRTFGTCGGVGQPACEDSVPEPAPLALLGLGLTGLAIARRRRKH